MWKAAAQAVLACMFVLGTLPACAQDKPNVILMLADNVGYGDIGAFQGGEIRGMPTPRIDQLAREGLTLTPVSYRTRVYAFPGRIEYWAPLAPQRVGIDHRCGNAKYIGGGRDHDGRAVQEPRLCNSNDG